MKNKKEKTKDHSNTVWFIKVFISTFILSMIFSYVSANGVSGLGLVPAILILVLVIAIGIFFDIVGVAVTVANEHEFHAKATKKVKGSKISFLYKLFTVFTKFIHNNSNSMNYFS